MKIAITLMWGLFLLTRCGVKGDIRPYVEVENEAAAKRSQEKETP